MTTKTKVLKILDQYRDMSLTMGCEVVTKSVRRRLTSLKVKELESQYGKCMLIADFFNLPDDEYDYIEINSSEYVEELQDMDSVATVISPKKDIFNGVRVAQKTHCEVTAYPEDKNPIKITSSCKNTLFSEMYWRNKYRVVKILGHPATPLVLLKALGEKENAKGYWITDTGCLIEQAGHQKTICTIPLTPTLSEIPEEHKMWQAVLDVLI